MQDQRYGFICPEGTSLVITKPNGDTFTALVEGTFRIVNHVEVGEYPTPDNMIGASFTADLKAVEDDDNDGRLYLLVAGTNEGDL